MKEIQKYGANALPKLIFGAPRSVLPCQALRFDQPLIFRVGKVFESQFRKKAGDGIRTHGLQLGKLTLCQLSYTRK